MRFYVASRLEDAVTAAEAAAFLKARGHDHTYDWTVHGSLQDQPEARLQQGAIAEMHGVTVVLLPGGRGTHTELGAALGGGLQVLLIGEETAARTCIFYHHPRVMRAAELDDATLDAFFERFVD